MSGLRSYRNLSAPPTVIRAGIPEVFLSGCDRGVKSFHLTPQPCLYMAWSPKSWGTNAEYNIDGSIFLTTKPKQRITKAKDACCCRQMHWGNMSVEGAVKLITV